MPARPQQPLHQLIPRPATNSSLDLYIAHATNGIKFTQRERQHLKRLKYEAHDQTTPAK